MSTTRKKPLTFHLVGDAHAGKSCLLQRYCDEIYEPPGDTEPHCSRTKTLEIEGKKVGIEIWDIPGSGRYRGIARLDVNAVIVAFDLTEQNSLSKVASYLDGYCHNPVVVLVGTKSDAKDRVIEQAEINAFKERSPRFKSAIYIETSAKENIKVSEVFERTAKLVLNRPTLSMHAESSSNNDGKRNSLMDDLNNYIARINPDNSTTPNFSRFWFPFFKNSRALNREANYHLAKELLVNLKQSNASIQEIFTDVTFRRSMIINNYKLFLNPDFKDRGINSAELNKIINKARKR